jgi:PAS domain-containing protein
LFWERKKGSEHLHPEGLGFGKLFEVIRNAVIAADAKAQRTVLWNSAAIGLFGYSPSEALNGTCDERLPPERFKAQQRARMAYDHETGRVPYIALTAS